MTNDFNKPTDELIQKLKYLQLTKVAVKELEEMLDANKKELAELEAECVILMDNASVSQVKLEGALLYRKTDKYASIDKENTAEAWGWLKANDLSYLIQETVNSRSLMSALNELTEDILEKRPASIKISPVERIGMRKK